MTTSWVGTLPGSGEMLTRLRAHDWAATPLGPPDTWPERLRGSVALALSSRFPLMIAWGPDLVQIYNDGYLPIFGEKHPQLGVPIRETWSEIWHVVGPMLQGVLDSREATWAEDQLLWIDRLGFAEDTYFTFSYSPVLDSDGIARGVLATAMETTLAVIGARRARALGAVVPGRAASAAEAAGTVVAQLAGHPDDVPFAMVYLGDQQRGHALAASTVEDAAWSTPGSSEPWPLDLVSDQPTLVDVPAGCSVVHEAAGRLVRQAALVRLGEHGTLVCGVSPGRRVDATHLDFLAALGRQVEASLALGHAFADARQQTEERLATERASVEREAEERSLAAAARFRFAGARVGTWTVDLLTEEAVVDESLERMFGVPPGTLHRVQEVMDLIVPSDRERITAALSEVAEQGGEFFVEFEVVRPDGSRRAFQSRAIASEDEQGAPRLLHGALWDATELLEAQAAARESEERLRSALEFAPWGIAVVEADGRVSRANRALCDMVGRSQAELLGTPFQVLVHEDDGDPLTTDGGDAPREVRLLGPARASTWVSLSAAQVRAEDGRLLHRMVHVYDHSERKQLEADLQRLADHDSLTGLLNRRRFSEELERALKQAGRDEGGAVLMIDMDGLKQVNDTLGHTVGDALLVALADTLRTRLRETDSNARLGGDEFAAILPRIQPSEALELARELITHFRESAPLGSDVSVSIGIALLDGRGGHRVAEDIMTEADAALYVAKDAGRGQVRLYERESRSRTLHRPRRWTDRVRAALDHDGFVLHGQLIRALGEHLSDQEELLLRMIGEDGTPVLPTNFLLAAERSTLILDVDRWVVRTAVQELARRQAHDPEARLAVNLSARSLTDPRLSSHIEADLAAAGADPKGLVLEITETAAVVNVAQARSFMRAMSALGCSLSLDDFGAGFTSLQYLKHLEFDYLKIDGEFIRDLTTSPVNQSIVRAVAELARRLGKRTIAEHVGDHASLEWLQENGVDYAQGFHLGVPTPLGTAAALRP